MVSRQIDGDYVGEVYRILTNNPTSQNLDFLIEARAVIGNYVAIAEAEYDNAKGQRQYDEAQGTLVAKSDNPKWTAQQVEAFVRTETNDAFIRENAAKASYSKLKSLLESLTEAINGIKFLGRMGG
jgi:hypothetical protein